MKKIEQAAAWLKKNYQLFRCPYCESAFRQPETKSLICQQGHSFDLSKKGTLYLLKKSYQTNYDDPALWQSRRKLLQAGLFTPIFAKIKDLLPTSSSRILDAGCGEGSALAYFAAEKKKNDTLVGFDLAKSALNLATQLDSAAFFCEADLANLPFQTASFDAICDIFTPSAYQEFERVLVPGGRLVKVIPGPAYLAELRHLLYAENSGNYNYSNQKVKNLFFEHYPTAKELALNYKFSLNSTTFQQLLKMTPLQWGASEARLTEVQQLTLPEITVDVVVLTAKID
ncbi:methyltransferase domain-containing protein [Liquorilactobacillus nagelii]|uniref:methyltransferase domain-containing protein n=1 Tax=Liquorilactobacillus nagelii TaxID=82688 RepID=UPI0039EC74BB